ncbi:MAG: hypothetical protein U1E78_04520 [Gammaproteobacteria bacterium]
MKQTSLDSFQLLLRALTLYKSTFWPAALLSLFAAGCWFEPQFFFISTKDLSLKLALWFIPAGLGAFILWMSVVIYQYGAMHIFDYTIGHALLLSLKRLGPTVIVLLLYMVIVACGTILLILPGFILSMTLMLSIFLVVTNKSSIMNALLYSHNLIWPELLRVSLIISVPIFIYIAPSLVSYLLIMKLALSFEHFHYYATLAQAFIQILTLPYLFCVALCLMQDLEIRHHSRNLLS